MRQTVLKERKKKNGLVIVFLVLLLAALIVVLVTAYCRNHKDKNSYAVKEDTEQTTEKWQEGVVSYNGKHYSYNNHLRTYLYLGIDKEEPVEKSTDGISGGQSDALFLLVMNEQEESLSVIAINRNTMTDIETYDEAGDYVGNTTAQICLQHGYGDGMRTSCSRTVDAVSHLLYDVPINGYLSMNMGAIPMLNDAVGGVSVSMEEDITDDAKGVSLKNGDTVTLAGDEAYVYLHNRDTTDFDSASRRLQRHQQYLINFLPQAKQLVQQNQTAVLDIYNSIEDYLVTNIDFVKLAREAAACSFDESRMYTIPGQTVMGTSFEEYYVDEQALYELILAVFYKPVD